MFEIGRDMSRDVQTKFADAKKKYFQEILFPLLKLLMNSLNVFWARPPPSKSTETYSLIHMSTLLGKRTSI